MNQLIFSYLNGFAGKTEWFDTFVYFSAEYLGWWLLAAFFALVMFGKNDFAAKIEILISAGFSMAAALALTQTIRFFYYNARPFVDNDVYSLVNHASTASFPSAHAAVFFALAAFVFLFRAKLRGTPLRAAFISAVFFAAAFIIASARVIGGIHWPADILAGAAVGILSALTARYLRGKVCLKFKRRRGSGPN